MVGIVFKEGRNGVPYPHITITGKLFFTLTKLFFSVLRQQYA